MFDEILNSCSQEIQQTWLWSILEYLVIIPFFKVLYFELEASSNNHNPNYKLNWNGFDLVNEDCDRELDQYRQWLSVFESAHASGKQYKRKETIHKYSYHLAPTLGHYNVTLRFFFDVWVELSIDIILLVVWVLLFVEITCWSQSHFKWIGESCLEDNSANVGDEHCVENNTPVDAISVGGRIVTHLRDRLINFTVAFVLEWVEADDTIFLVNIKLFSFGPRILADWSLVNDSWILWCGSFSLECFLVIS